MRQWDVMNSPSAAPVRVGALRRGERCRAECITSLTEAVIAELARTEDREAALYAVADALYCSPLGVPCGVVTARMIHPDLAIGDSTTCSYRLATLRPAARTARGPCGLIPTAACARVLGDRGEPVADGLKNLGVTFTFHRLSNARVMRFLPHLFAAGWSRTKSVSYGRTRAPTTRLPYRRETEPTAGS